MIQLKLMNSYEAMCLLDCLDDYVTFLKDQVPCKNCTDPYCPACYDNKICSEQANWISKIRAINKIKVRLSETRDEVPEL